MTDQEKIAVLKASLCNIGRLIPAGMSITFRRDPDARASVMEQTYPDGEVVKAEFSGHTPIYTVPVVPSEYGVIN
jgi:hypothetical protein